jgi:hypothetical protein
MTIVHCPRCRDEVTVPARASVRALVRCPLCLEQYLLGEALDQLPPSLIVLDGSLGGEEPELVGAGVAADLVAAEASGEYKVAGGGFEAALDSRPGVGATVAPARPGVKGTRPKRKPRSAIVELTKIVVGGLVGCVLAPLVLWWVFNNDSLNIGPKVAPYAPWIVPARFHGKPATTERDTASAAPANPPTDEGASRPDKGETAKSGRVTDLPTSEPFPNPTLPDDPLNIENPLATTSQVSPATSTDTQPEVKPQKNKSAKGKTAKTNPGPFVPESQPTKLNPPGDPTSEPALPTAADFGKAVLAAAERLSTLNDAPRDAPTEQKQQLYTDVYQAAADAGRMTTYLSTADADLADHVATLQTFLTALTMGKMNGLKSLTDLKLPEKKHDEGVLVAAVVQDFRSAGSMFECTVQAGRKLTETPIVCATNPQDFCQVGDDVLVIGRIVEDPQKHIPGYEGEHMRVVLYGYSVTAAKAD